MTKILRIVATLAILAFFSGVFALVAVGQNISPSPIPTPTPASNSGLDVTMLIIILLVIIIVALVSYILGARSK